MTLLAKEVSANQVNENQGIFINFMILVGDICRESPNLIDRLIEEGVVESIFRQLTIQIPDDQESIPMVVYFVNMVCLIQKGVDLENQYNIIDKLFGILIDPAYLETFYQRPKITRKHLQHRAGASLAVELNEFIMGVPKLKQKVADNLDATL